MPKQSFAKRLKYNIAKEELKQRKLAFGVNN